MRKNLIVLALFLVSANTLLAQTDDSQNDKPRFGAKGGVNISNFVGDDSGSSKSYIGFNVGFFAEFQLTERFYIQPELLYSAQGAKENLTIEGINFDATLKANYLTIPVMFKYYVSNDLSLEAGPYVGFLTSAKIKFESSFGSGTEDAKEFFKSTDFGVGVGLNYNITQAIFLNARYAAGLAKIGDTETNDNDVKNSVFQFGLGFRF
jgi:opacity protein-like surface antigen